MKRLFIFCLVLAVLAFAGCGGETGGGGSDDSGGNAEEVQEPDAGADEPAGETGEETGPGSSNLPIFTSSEIYDFPLLRSNWTKLEFDAQEDLIKESDDILGETIYYNGFIKYTFLDWAGSANPDVVEVTDSICPGPRGITVGDSFESVLSLFPLKEDWLASEHGEFYGKVSFDDYGIAEADAGYVSRNDDGSSEVTFLVGGSEAFFRVFFENNTVVNFTFYLTHNS